MTLAVYHVPLGELVFHPSTPHHSKATSAVVHNVHPWVSRRVARALLIASNQRGIQQQHAQISDSKLHVAWLLTNYDNIQVSLRMVSIPQKNALFEGDLAMDEGGTLLLRCIPATLSR